MRKLLLVALLIVMAVAAGCTTRYTVTDATPPVTPKLERGQSVYVAVPKDGSFGDRTYADSGQQTATSLQAALTQYASLVLVGTQYEDPQAAMESATAKKARYVFVPVITNWVHRLSTLSAKSSGVSLTVTVYDLNREGEDKRVLQKNLRVQGRNVSFANQHPGEILKPLLAKFAAGAF